ncbi:50S ribosomal protein L35 [Alienimonas chondri]|uniref:Large ribosomal subunit protein bL35 n=1 Tax=Alienimonas chondri TaxID=2681879 RepID=A0ABX1VAE1_9PLAN|nr:50S ribosomal protein L35 [Alienimonas chondri]NNJ25033.1 50S ribosomal protein L35 [Alienimonas chondri]
MPKQKTHKGMKKRFKITASGKATHRSSNRGHKLSGKSASRKRDLRTEGIICGTEAKKIAKAIAPGK